MRFVMVVVDLLVISLEGEAEATGVGARFASLVVPCLVDMVFRLLETTFFDCTFLGVHLGRDLITWVGESMLVARRVCPRESSYMQGSFKTTTRGVRTM